MMGHKPIETEEEWRWFRVKLRLAPLDDLETICLGHIPEQDTGIPPEPKSDAWFAHQIFAAIQATRHQIEQQQFENAVDEAVTVGLLAGSWPPARKWRERQSTLREAARKGGKANSPSAVTLNRVVAIAHEVRLETPYEPTAVASTRWLARIIAERLRMQEGTIRGLLRRLDLK